jgi:hypothetical protein
MSKLFNLSEGFDGEREAMGEHKIPFRKFYSQLSAQSRKDSKPEKCYYCGEEVPSFCNSHSLPAFVLRQIAEQGKLYTINAVIDSPLNDGESGINNSATFHIICKQCDGVIFKDYENPENYSSQPTDLMIAQMAMKNYLRQIGKRIFERSLYQNVDNGLLPIIEDQLRVIDLDLSENIRGFKKAKKATEKSWGDEYYLFFHETLDYVVPIAFQGQLNLHVGLNGERINDVFNEDKSYKIQPLHASIFPLKDKSVVLLFIEKESKRYRPFYKAFGKLSLEEKLSAINYMLFALSEDVFLSKNIRDEYIHNDNLREVFGLTSIHMSNTPGIDNDLVKNSFNFSKADSIPNFLTMQIEPNEN